MGVSRMNKYIPATVACLVAAPFLIRGFPWLLLYPNSSLMLLFNHEVTYVSSSQTLVFFNSGAIHSFFPFSYVFARVFFLYVPSPVLVEFVFPAAISFILLSALALLWLRNLPSEDWYLSWFAFGSLSLLYLIGTAAATSLWFSSIGLWELLVFLCLLRYARAISLRTPSVSVVAVLLLVAMLLGDDGVAFLAAVFALVMQAGLLTRQRVPYLRWAMLSAIMFLSYEAAIGFIGEVYYGTYLPVLRSQLTDLLSFNLQLSTHLNYLSLPLYQTVGSAVAFFAMFGVVPILLLGYSLRRGWKLTSLLVPGLILLVGVSLRLSSIVTAQPAYVGALYEYVLYLVLPVSLLAAVRAKVEAGGTLRGARLRRYGYVFFAIVSICVLVLATFQFNPLIPTGKVSVVTDSRVEPVYVQAAGIFASGFGLTSMTTAEIGDSTVLFVNPSNLTSNYILTSPLPSPFHLPFKPAATQELCYTNGIIVIAGK
jgi:hypothetical protein